MLFVQKSFKCVRFHLKILTCNRDVTTNVIFFAAKVVIEIVTMPDKSDISYSFPDSVVAIVEYTFWAAKFSLQNRRKERGSTIMYRSSFIFLLLVSYQKLGHESRSSRNLRASDR